ncbi:hypothetical protein KW794_03735 [Candidatus Saccharibacteria bacterium]|nr:hypothetical protein [Candidatus Saccharibacteria bacterium]
MHKYKLIRNTLKALLPVSLIVAAVVLIPKGVNAANSASLYLMTTCGPGANQITISIHENSGSTLINGVQSDLNYSAAQFSVVSSTVASGWSQAQNDTSTAGSILLGAFPSPPGAYVSGDQVVGNVVLQAKSSSGLANAVIANSSQVAVDGTDILTSKTHSTYPLNMITNCGTVADTPVPHPSGTLVALNGRVYLLSTDNNGVEVRSLITSGDVFTSYGYPWFLVKTGTNGDSNLPPSPSLNTLAPGTIFASTNTPVYIMTYESGNLVKQQVSLSAFNSLGYTWNDVQHVDPGSVPAANASGILFAAQHPAGTLVSGGGKIYFTLVSGGGKIYLLDQTTKRWIYGPDAFTTNNFVWAKVKTATSADMSQPDGSNVYMRQGNMLLTGGGIFVVDYDGSGILKRPVGPWECFANRWHYASRDLYQPTAGAVPSRTGSIATC